MYVWGSTACGHPRDHLWWVSLYPRNHCVRASVGPALSCALLQYLWQREGVSVPGYQAGLHLLRMMQTLEYIGSRCQSFTPHDPKSLIFVSCLRASCLTFVLATFNDSRELSACMLVCVRELPTHVLAFPIKIDVSLFVSSPFLFRLMVLLLSWNCNSGYV